MLFVLSFKGNAKTEFPTEFNSIIGRWQLVEFVGNIRESNLIPEPEDYRVSDMQIEEHNRMFLNTEIIINIKTVRSCIITPEWSSDYDHRNLFGDFRLPATITPREPIIYVMLEHMKYENDIRFILGSDGSAFLQVDHYFYRLERVLLFN
jgi:hypothetical protein